MDFQTLKTTLSNQQTTQMSFTFDSGRDIAAHFHVTEVGKATKDFIDCGGVRRSSETCMLQTLVASDVDHRLSPGKLLSILEKSEVLQIREDAEVEVETQGQTIEIYSIASATPRQDVLVFHLAPKTTACLAPDKCGIPDLEVVSLGCCGGNTDANQCTLPSSAE
ncbi:DUF6428 family protein [Calycomorphotria hydatis]|uniref:Uncharacterized protein n=1 Tax=Calycomorphotria hydatis TaxID=2528027 RepID=A0A517TF66_9PLAN|nr:DUF6428 family protein [Calycomorphotria hydatis]QDT67021.1 hypothetical protein V22_42930 [Calycomorphotria hydatis]